MTIVDVNVLLYLINHDAASHAQVLAWWSGKIDAGERLGIPWYVVQSFLRLATHRRVFLRPQRPAEAVARIDEWLACPECEIVAEASNHWAVLRGLVTEQGVAGDHINDAYLAAHAISRGATLASCDQDFSRYRNLRWENPAAAKRGASPRTH
ncbi:MAG: PIN domain-containing protein [Pirellulales bacterium]|nr:PIN domain-containing protein [Pirellulales bacterium]